MTEFRKLNLNDIERISNWEYYSGEKISMEPYLKSFLNGYEDPRGFDNCIGRAVYFESRILGLFEYYERKEGMEIGLVLSPEFRGKGKSELLLVEGIKYAYKTLGYSGEKIYLTVEEDNVPAVRAYIKFGFEEYSRFTDEGNKENIKMFFNCRKFLR